MPTRALEPGQPPPRSTPRVGAGWAAKSWQLKEARGERPQSEEKLRCVLPPSPALGHCLGALPEQANPRCQLQRGLLLGDCSMPAGGFLLLTLIVVVSHRLAPGLLDCSKRTIHPPQAESLFLQSNRGRFSAPVKFLTFQAGMQPNSRFPELLTASQHQLCDSNGGTATRATLPLGQPKQQAHTRGKMSCTEGKELRN